MDKFAHLLQLLEIEEEPFEYQVLLDWVAKEGIDRVYEKCLQIISEEKQNRD